MFSGGPGYSGTSYGFSGFSSGFGAGNGFLSEGVPSTEGGFLAGATQDVTGDHMSMGGDRQKGNDGQKIYPLKISLIQRFFSDNPHEHRFKLFGEEITMFKLVGLVRDLNIDEALEKWTFTLDDSSGIINVEWLAQRHRDYLEGEPSSWMKKQFSKIQNNSYVRVHGDINLLGKLEPHVSAFFVSGIDIIEEIFYHDTHVAHLLVHHYPENTKEGSSSQKSDAFSSLEKHLEVQQSFLHGGSNQSTNEVQNGTLTPIQSNKPFYPTSIAHQLPKALPEVLFNPSTLKVQDGSLSITSSTIIEILKNMSILKPQGLTEEELLTQLIGRGIGIQSEQVNNECRILMQRGAVFQSSIGIWKLTGL